MLTGAGAPVCLYPGSRSTLTGAGAPARSAIAGALLVTVVTTPVTLDVPVLVAVTAVVEVVCGRTCFG